ncbi:MAG: 30S ribosomal protein S13 [Candidatus Bathyarchaeia archaeon]
MSEGFKHIVRISGVDVNGSKKLPYGLAKIRGVGVNFAKAVVKAAGLSWDMPVGKLTEEDVQKLESVITHPEKYGVPSYLYNRRKDLEKGVDIHLHGSDLDLRTKMDIEFMKGIRSWKGIRHSLGLKVRGQKTRTCGRTGRAVGVRKKELKAEVGEKSK